MTPVYNAPVSKRATKATRPPAGTDSTAALWWQPVALEDGPVSRFTIGPLTLHVQRLADEWRLAWSHAPENPDDVHWSVQQLSAEALPEAHERYVFATGEPRLQLRPRLADRPVVIRPRSPVYLPSGQQTKLYLSTPLTLEVRAGEHQLLREIPMVPLSDTWFGPSTREGEFCYSARTHARHALEEVPRRPHRAITPLLVRNDASSVLPLEKLSLPVPMLSVFGSGDGAVWTEEVSLVRERDGDLAAIQIGRNAPSAAGQVELLSGPRQVGGRTTLVRAFSVLFGG